MALEQKVRSGDVERITVRLPVDQYKVLTRYSELMPGSTPASLIREIIEEAIPGLEQLLDAAQAIKLGHHVIGMASVTSLMASIEARARSAKADVEAFSTTLDKGGADA